MRIKLKIIYMLHYLSCYFMPNQFKLYSLVYNLKSYTKYCQPMLHPDFYFWKPKSNLASLQCDFFKYLLTQQQIQQMSQADEDNGLLLFYKFKSLLFDQNEDDELIINRIRQQPLKVCGAMLYQLTCTYNQKLMEITEPLLEQKKHLQKKIQEKQQRLQNEIDANQHFLATIDRLQEQVSKAKEDLNESIDQFSRSKDQIIIKMTERQQIQSKAMKFYNNHKQIFAQNSQLQQTLQQYQKTLQILKQQNLKIKTTNQQLFQSNRILKYKCQELINNQTYQIQQIQLLNNKLCDKQQQIASMQEEYNNIRLFNQEDAYSQIYQQIKMKQSYNNELIGFNFNNYEKSQNISEKTMSKNSSVCNLDNDMDEKFQNVNATAEKNRPKIAFNSICQTEEKKGKKIDGKMSSKQRIINSNYMKCSRKIQLNIPSSGQSKKKLIKTVSSKNFNEDSAKLPSASQGNDSKMMEQFLKNKLNQKNIMISKLQSEKKTLKEGLIKQGQILTNIEGKYELQIQDIKDLLTYTKRQLATLYQKYVISCAQCQMYREKAETLEQQHHSYCKQLKEQCKQYVIHRINAIQQEHNNLKIYWQRQIQALEQLQMKQMQRQQPNQLRQIQENQYNRQQFLLQFKESPASNDNYKIDSFSEIQCNQKLESHYVNGFDLELSSKLSYCDPYHEEIYVQQQFQIESDLGRFTERIVNQHQSIKKEKQRGNFTDRGYVSSFKDDNLSISASQKPSLSLNTRVVQNCIKSTQDRSLMICSNINEYFLPFNKEQINQSFEIHFNHLVLQSNLYNITNPISDRKSQFLSQGVCISYIPQIKQLKLKSSQIIVCYTPINKSIALQSHLFTQTILPYSPNLSLYSSLYSFNKNEKVYGPLSVQNNYNIQLQISKNRNLQLIQKTIDVKEVIKRKHSYQVCISPFQSIPKLPSSHLITSHQIFQQYPTFKMTQETVQTSIAQTQYSEKILLNQYCIQVGISENTQQKSIQTDKLSVITTTIQTEEIQTLCQQSQTLSQNYTDFSMNTQCNNKRLKLQSKSVELIIQEKQQRQSDSFYNEKSVLRLVRIPSFNLNFTNKKSASTLFKQQLSAIPPSTVCSNNQQLSPKQIINSSKNIYEETEYEIGENQNREISQLDSQQQEKCHKQIEFGQQNLSTKNDDYNLEVQERPKQHSIYRKQSAQQNLSPNHLHQEQKMDSLNLSILNKGFIYSKTMRQQTKTFNPESKSYRNQRLNHTEVDISPWFIDENKFSIVPQQIISRLNAKSLHYLEKHLQKTKSRLSIQQIIDKKPFNRPNTLKDKVYLFFCKSSQKIFLVNSYTMIDLTSGGYLQIQDNHRIDVNNFVFGQSQVRITKNAQIIINRCDKKNKLPGTIPDGQWHIEYYLTCNSHKRKLTSHY